VVRFLANPLTLRAGVVLFCAGFAFLMGMIFIRLLRKSIDDEANILTDTKPSLENLPLHLYNTVIEQLKQQKHELIAQSQSEQQRARTSETFSQAVLSNLSSGVLVFGTNGLVKSSNPAAKKILGFASTTGMGADDIFRGAMVQKADIAGPGATSDFPDSGFEDPVFVSDEVAAVLREGVSRQGEAEYETPAGETRPIAVKVSAVKDEHGVLLGATCLINDRSEAEKSQQLLHSGISAETALEFRRSLHAISAHARQLAEARDTTQREQLADDIAQEAASLDQKIVGVLGASCVIQGASAAAND
jgi:PAS domain-containing protein